MVDRTLHEQSLIELEMQLGLREPAPSEAQMRANLVARIAEAKQRLKAVEERLRKVKEAQAKSDEQVLADILCERAQEREAEILRRIRGRR